MPDSSEEMVTKQLYFLCIVMKILINSFRSVLVSWQTRGPRPRDRMPGIKSLILIVHHPIFALLADLSQGISEISWLTDNSGKRFRSTCQKDQHREGGIFATFCLDLQEYFSTGRSPSNSLSSSTLEINPQVFPHLHVCLFFPNCHEGKWIPSLPAEEINCLYSWDWKSPGPNCLEFAETEENKGPRTASLQCNSRQLPTLPDVNKTLLKYSFFLCYLSYLYTSLKSILILQVLLEGAILEINPRLAKWEAFQVLTARGWGDEPGKAQMLCSYIHIGASATATVRKAAGLNRLLMQCIAAVSLYGRGQ